MPRNKSINKVLVIGSGPIVIGQAAEFDYAGTQACRVLKDMGVNVVLVNSNPATIMTDAALADEIYLEPLNAETVRRIIEKERPDGMLATLGGQTGLTIASELEKEGFLEKSGVRLLGTNAQAIDRAEDRKLFAETMKSIGQPIIPSGIAVTVEEAVEVANQIGYPVIVRPAFTLGGTGGGVAEDEASLREIADAGLMLSPIHQALIEKYIYGWKEIEFEALRDSAGNAIAVCSMENVDPVGVHTGDSVVVAPALTLAAPELSMLRQASLDIVEALGIEGGCNCQFALDPVSFQYAVIEVNPRLSRSSALASKATGYPIAKVAAKIAMGLTLDEIVNDVTGETYACVEPTIDYVVVKLPRFPFDKFVGASHALGTQMKATGEVMSIGPTFEAALMKAIRGAEIKMDTLNYAGELDYHKMDDQRLFAVFQALKKGVSIDEIYAATRIDRFFLNKLNNLAKAENAIAGRAVTEEEYIGMKRLGYTDKAIARISGNPLPAHRCAVYKMVDTCAAEFRALTPYFYSTYDDVCESRERKQDKPCVVVLGSGPIRIGQGIEFDYSSVHCVWTLKKLGYDVVIINNNPETVSTDFDTADRLYFEPLTEEDVLNVIEVEKPVGVVVAFGGQTAIKLTKCLDERGIQILGTSAEGIDMAEDRERFDALLQQLDIRRPESDTAMDIEGALRAANRLGYPVLLRPSYVIGGQNMTIAQTDDDVKTYMRLILAQGIENPVLVDKYMRGTELEVDAISDGTDVLIPGVMEHIERAGVHSGDSIAVYPPYNLTDKQAQAIVDCSTKLALALGTRGLVNIQYLIHGGELYVIEVNPRASRTIPYISKVSGVPMVDIATRVMMGESLASLGYASGIHKTPPYYAVKVPVFSFQKLPDANSALGPEMKSTGEVLGVGKTLREALFKGFAAAGFNIGGKAAEKKGVLISIGIADDVETMRLAKKFYDMGHAIYATKDTAKVIRSLGIPAEEVGLPGQDDGITALITEGMIDYVVFEGISTPEDVRDYIQLHRVAMMNGVVCLTSTDTANALADILQSRFNLRNTELVDIAHMRTERQKLSFLKMQGTGDDYIFLENFGGRISCPESLAIDFTDRSCGIGGDGLALIESSSVADAKMRVFNQDGSEASMAGNAVRCVAKYLYDRGLVNTDTATVETLSGVKKINLYTVAGRVHSAEVDMGKAEFEPAKIPVKLPGEKIVNRPVMIDGIRFNITCVNVGTPHCVTFCRTLEDIDVERIGRAFEHAEIFPERINTNFVRVADRRTLRMRVWERGNGETRSCGTGACAAVVAAAENDLVDKNADITVKLAGGDLIVNYDGETVRLTGNANLIYEGTIEY
ncbi:MAG: carbamoyl-phosphate synthase large subunit [Clostridiales bacterium]|nr:carbamoyl-phosphate synthase large subunit [Clostridiales bacterium]